MASPFPGMDPYLEDPAVWEEFHHVFITECMYHLLERLPPAYLAKIGERVELVSRGDEAAEQYLPDVALIREESAPHRAMGEPSGGGAALAVAPVTIASLDSVEVKEGHIEVRRLPDYELVTSIELLSPWNKFGEGIGEYRHKRRALVNQGVHVVEIDLLRRGRRTELAEPLPWGQYYAFVFRGDRRPEVNVYAWDLRQALPRIFVPLRSPDGDVALELAAVVGTAYERAGYARKIDYTVAAPEPMSPEDAAWAADVARRGGSAIAVTNPMHSKTPPRNRLAKVLPEEWRKHLVACGAPRRKYTAVCRATLAGGRVIEELIVEEGWIIALSRTGLAGVFEQRIDFDPRLIVDVEVLQIV